MDLRLQFLESFTAQGSDGQSYKVCAYDRLASTGTGPNGQEQWESTGQAEYRLEDGRLVEVRRDGSMHIAHSDVELSAEKAPAGT
ncbi:hypothetical protein [Ramlibacter rhizophilus]|uniref:Uncharacterized protein n=1 Tax=Ramlibacter rhizophilus TaxID=1781167 RepID=A0A4Z0BPH8_9BURK|nr:hypothetical protein [Ramlibacter rhizophilus]TFZ01203.1 hypothetical protein EZ242_07400 [Ramlibacter rhizophilus]